MTNEPVIMLSEFLFELAEVEDRPVSLFTKDANGGYSLEALFNQYLDARKFYIE